MSVPAGTDDIDDADAFRCWLPAVPEARHWSGGHLTALAADDLLFAARGTYFAEHVRWPGIGPHFWLVYRRMEIDYLREAFLGEQLRSGTRALGRGRRSIQLRQVLQVAADQPRTIAVARLVVVAFDVTTRLAVDVPDGLWDAIASYEAGARAERYPVR